MAQNSRELDIMGHPASHLLNPLPIGLALALAHLHCPLHNHSTSAADPRDALSLADFETCHVIINLSTKFGNPRLP
jgi:hypothetical protein